MPKLLNSGKGQAQFIYYADTNKGLNFTAGTIYFRMDAKPEENVRDHMEAVHTRLASVLKGTTFTLFPVSMESGSLDKPSFAIDFRAASVAPISVIIDALKNSKLAEGSEVDWISVAETLPNKPAQER